MGVQVRTATYINGERAKGSLSEMERQFISFKWGDKNIEDFDLLVVNSSDRMEKSLYASFNDTTKSYTYIDGQSYWGSTLQANTIDFTCATDGMDSKMLEDFKAYFCPGVTRKLILAEYPFRYAMARVSEAPSMSMLPFDTKINNSFRTTEYKGEITLRFVMDDPYWYNNDDSVYFSGELSELQNKDVYETGTPILEVNQDCWYAGCCYNKEGTIKNISDVEQDEAAIDVIPTKAMYCGTAPGLPILKVKYTATFASSNPPYVTMPYSSYAADSNGIKVNAVSIGDSIVQFTLPPLLSSYNQALYVIENIADGTDMVEAKAEVREQLSNSIVRKWAIAALNATEALSITDGTRTTFYGKMKTMFNTSDLTIIYTFNSITGEINAQYNAVATTYGSEDRHMVTETAGTCLKSAMPTIPAKDVTSTDANLVTIKAPNATHLQLTYNYRFY